MLRNIQPDKWKHFFVGIPMGSVLQLACNWLIESPVTSVVIAFALVAGISYGFELFSKITRIGHYDFRDAVASVIGGILGMGLIWIV